MKRLFRIDGGHFVAGLEMDHEEVVYAAPIIRWMMGKTEKYMKEYCSNRGWHCQELTSG